jgi:hypothetical protein
VHGLFEQFQRALKLRGRRLMVMVVGRYGHSSVAQNSNEAGGGRMKKARHAGLEFGASIFNT